jgi:chromosome partitioning protein
VSQSLTRFLSSLDIPLITTLRDTQNYVRSAEIGLGVYEMPQWQVQQDLPQWQEVLSWLAERRPGQSAASQPKSLAAVEPRGSEPELLAVASAGREAAPAPAALSPSMAVAGFIGASARD